MPNAVEVKSFENYHRKSSSSLATKMLVKLPLGANIIKLLH
jgi:hypothetical protein